MAAKKAETKTKAEETKNTAQSIGVVLLDAVLANFPQNIEAKKQLAELAKNKDALIAAEQDETKRQQMLAEGRKEYAEEERKTMGLVYQAVNGAISDVAKEKKLSAVYNMGAILYGGTDITKDVIEKLNAQR